MTRLPIEQHAFLSDCRGSALVTKNGSVDWWCDPRFDSPPTFARLLDDQAGHFSIASDVQPVVEDADRAAHRLQVGHVHHHRAEHVPVRRPLEISHRSSRLLDRPAADEYSIDVLGERQSARDLAAQSGGGAGDQHRRLRRARVLETPPACQLYLTVQSAGWDRRVTVGTGVGTTEAVDCSVSRGWSPTPKGSSHR